MRELLCEKIADAKTSQQAEKIIARLRMVGLHPMELSLTVPFLAVELKCRFPIKVPMDEVERALEALH